MFAVNADGSHLREVSHFLADTQDIIWSRKPGEFYVTGSLKADTERRAWRLPADGSAPEAIGQGCGMVIDVSPDGKHLLMSQTRENPGIFKLSLADRECTPLVPGVESFFPHFSRDGKSILYTISSRGEVILYKLPWIDGKAAGRPQLVLKLPFAFRQVFCGIAFDVARDLS